MPFIEVPEAVGIEFLMRLDDQSIETTYYARVVGDPDESILEEIANVCLNWIHLTLFNVLSNQLTCIGVKCTSLVGAEAPTFTAVPETTVQGAVAQPSLPSNVAFVIKHLTAFRGRSGRGRSYIPGIPVTAMSDTNTMAAGTANALRGAYDTLDAALDAISATAVVVSRYTDNAPRAEGVTRAISAHAYTDMTTDSQRRRLPGRGR